MCEMPADPDAPVTVSMRGLSAYVDETVRVGLSRVEQAALELSQRVEALELRETVTPPSLEREFAMREWEASARETKAYEKGYAEGESSEAASRLAREQDGVGDVVGAGGVVLHGRKFSYRASDGSERSVDVSWVIAALEAAMRAEWSPDAGVALRDASIMELLDELTARCQST